MADRREKRRRWLWLLLLLGGAATAGWAWWSREAYHAAAEEKLREATKAAEAGWMAAEQATERQIREATAPLRDQIEDLRAAGIKTKTRTVTKWRTERIEVPIAKVCPDEMVPGPPSPVSSLPAPTTPSPEPHAPPLVEFEVRGVTASLETRAGNLFVAGRAELWRTAPPPPELLGSAPFSAPATEALTVREKVAAWRINLLAGADTDGYLLTEVTWQRRRRFGFWAGAAYDPDPSASIAYDYYRTGPSQWRIMGGVLFTLGRK